MIKNEFYTLNNGVNIPKIGFGTWQITNKKVAKEAVKYALDAGFAHIDTAAAYGNESYIGEALKETKTDRKSIFITSKLRAEKKGYDVAVEEFNKTIKNLGTEYLDLYLIHAPSPWPEMRDRKIDHTEENIASFKAMIDLYKAGKIKAIGVSNFNEKDIDALISATGFIPQVNQIFLSPFNPQKDLKNYCEKKGILVEAYSPLETGKIFKKEKMEQLKIKYNKTIAQISLRWCLDYNTLPLPKSTHKEYIENDIDLDFTLEKDDFESFL